MNHNAAKKSHEENLKKAIQKGLELLENEQKIKYIGKDARSECLLIGVPDMLGSDVIAIMNEPKLIELFNKDAIKLVDLSENPNFSVKAIFVLLSRVEKKTLKKILEMSKKYDIDKFFVQLI